MKTRLLTIIGIVVATIVISGLLFSSQSDNSKPFVESEYVEITGIINNWQPIDGPAFSLITNEPVNAQVSDAGIFLYGDVLKPYMKDKTAIIIGTLIPNYVEYKESLGLRSYGGDPHTATILVDEVQIKQESKPSETVLLTPAPFVDWTHDEIVQKLTSLTQDSNAEKTFDDKQKSGYTTDKGTLKIRKERPNDFSRHVDYGLYGKENTLPKDQAKAFVESLMKEIGYDLDGTEHVEYVDFGSKKEIMIQQKKDGWIIANEINRFNFRDDSTSIDLGRWYTDLDEFQIKYNQSDAKKIAYDFIKSKIKTDSKLSEISIQIYPPHAVEMKIIHDHLVYSISGIYPHTQVYVDAYSGDIVNADLINITGTEVPGCASVGVSKLTQQDIKKIEERVDTLLYYELTDNDLNQLPVLKEMVDATNSRIEYNDRVRLPISVEEWNGYELFFKEKFDQQHDVYYESDLRSNYVLYDDKIFTVRYNENYENVPLEVHLFPSNFDYERKAITVSKDEVIHNVPKFQEATEMIGTWEVSVRNSTGILESEQQRYQSYLFQKNTEKYGSDAEAYAHIFYYDGNYYEPSFVIC